MNTLTDFCFLCTKDYNCVLVENNVVTQVEYLFPEITITKMGVPLRICSVCDGALFAFSKFKQLYLESSLRLEARLTGAQACGAPRDPLQVDRAPCHTQHATLEAAHIKEELTEPTSLEQSTSECDLGTETSAELGNTDELDTRHVMLKTLEIKPEKVDIPFEEQDMEYFSGVEDTREENQPGQSSKDNETMDASTEIRNNHSVKKSFRDCSSNTELITQNIVNSTQNRCDACNKTFAVIKDFACTICNKSFVYPSLLNTHMKGYHGIKDFHCEVCGKSYKLKKSFEAHMKDMHEKTDVECSICKMTFSFRHELSQHLKFQHKLKSFHCDKCDVSYATKLRLNKHKKSHAKSKSYACPICYRVFSLANHVKFHMLSHSKNSDISLNTLEPINMDT